MILRINQKAHELTEEEFNINPDVFESDSFDFDMLLRFQVIVDPEPTIVRIFRKKVITEEDFLKLIGWNGTNYSWFCEETKSSSSSYVVASDDYILRTRRCRPGKPCEG